MTLLVLFGEVCVKKNWLGLYMLWFKFIFGLKVFELVSILFAIVPDYGKEYTTKENKNRPFQLVHFVFPFQTT